VVIGQHSHSEFRVPAVKRVMRAEKALRLPWHDRRYPGLFETILTRS